jgi:hypothetical protein
VPTSGAGTGWFGLGVVAQLELVDGGGFRWIVSCRYVAVASGEGATVPIAQSGVRDVVVEQVGEDLGRDGLRDLCRVPRLFGFVVGIPRGGASGAIIIPRLDARQSSGGKEERGNAKEVNVGQHLDGRQSIAVPLLRITRRT